MIYTFTLFGTPENKPANNKEVTQDSAPVNFVTNYANTPKKETIDSLLANPSQLSNAQIKKLEFREKILVDYLQALNHLEQLYGINKDNIKDHASITLEVLTKTAQNFKDYLSFGSSSFYSTNHKIQLEMDHIFSPRIKRFRNSIERESMPDFLALHGLFEIVAVFQDCLDLVGRIVTTYKVSTSNDIIDTDIKNIMSDYLKIIVRLVADAYSIYKAILFDRPINIPVLSKEEIIKSLNKDAEVYSRDEPPTPPKSNNKQCIII